MAGDALHTVTDIVTLLSAGIGSALAVYRSLSSRIAAVEERAAIHEGILRAEGRLPNRRRISDASSTSTLR